MTQAPWRAFAGIALIVAMLSGCATLSRTAPERTVPERTAPERVAPERVSFDSLDRDPATGAPVRLTGLLFKPKEGAEVRRPRGDRTAWLRRHVQRARLAARCAFAAASRHGGAADRGRLCRSVPGQFPAARAEGDLHRPESTANDHPVSSAARCARRAGVSAIACGRSRRPHRVAGLVARRERRAGNRERQGSPVARWKDRVGSPPYFRAGVAFYPGCFDALRARGGYAAATPLTLFVGGADDWTAPKPCIDLADRLIAAGEPVTITVYPDTYHGFDGPPRRGGCGSRCRTASIRAAASRSRRIPRRATMRTRS